MNMKSRNMQSFLFSQFFLALLLSQRHHVVESFVASPAKECDSSACILPDCFCSTTTPPLAVEDSPQIVMIGFDDALTELLYTTYYKNFFNLTNPDGCPIGVTYFLSHSYTDYILVNDIWNHGHEVASNSISHKTPTTYWSTLDYDGWVDEMYGMKQIAANFGNISIEDIVGSKSPFGQSSGDVQYKAQYDSGFLYDGSLSTSACTDPPLFPYTLDYKPEPKCEIYSQLISSYPGYWEVPLVAFNDSSNVPCMELDACPTIPNSTDDVFNFLSYNFNRYYTTNKAPFELFAHASWFETDASHWPGFYQFIEYLLSLPDVYIVTLSKAIAWMKQPTAIEDLPSFAPWSCPTRSNACFPKSSCSYNESQWMNVCGECPPHYPWVGDPYGNATVNRNLVKDF